MSDAERELRKILDRRDGKLKRYLKAIDQDFKPNPDGSITFSTRTFEALDKLRRRYRAIGRRIADVNGGGNAKSALLSAFERIDEAMNEFESAAQIGFSVEQVEALGAAAQKMDRAVGKVKKIRKGLPK